MILPNNLQNELEQLSDPAYKKFCTPLLPGVKQMMGIRIPVLRNLAKQIVRQENWQSFIGISATGCYEKTMLEGMIIALAKMTWEEKRIFIAHFIPNIDNWGICDSFCSSLKTITQEQKEDMWNFIQPYIKSYKEFEKRFGIVMLLYYIDKQHIKSVMHIADHFEHQGYYARMAMAWILSMCFAKFPEETMKFLQTAQLDKWTYNKTLQKIIESKQVETTLKSIIRSMKRI